MGEEDNSDFEIEDVENWKGEGEHKFSHQSLVMQALDSVFKNGAKDLHPSFENIKIDKNGNAIRTYEEDTRKIFMGSIKGLIMLTHRDWKESKIYKPLIEEKLNEIFIRKKFWLNEQWNWWIKLNAYEKQQMMQKGIKIIPNIFESKLEFDNMFMNEEEEIYRQVATLICDFIKDDMKDYEGTVWTA